MAACQWISPEDASPKSLRTPLGTSWALQGCFILTSIWSIWGSWTHEVEQVYELLASFSDLSCIFVDLATVYYISKWEIWRLELVNPVCICLTLYFVYLVIVNMSHPATALSWYNPSLSDCSAPLLFHSVHFQQQIKWYVIWILNIVTHHFAAFPHVPCSSSSYLQFLSSDCL